MMVYRFSNGSSCADLEISDSDYSQVKMAMGMRGFNMTERNPGPPTIHRLNAEELSALFTGGNAGDVRGPGDNGKSTPMGVVAGDIRIRGGLAIGL